MTAYFCPRLLLLSGLRRQISADISGNLKSRTTPYFRKNFPERSGWEDEIKRMRPPDLCEVVCELSPTEMWYHLRFVPMQEAAAAQKRAAAEKLYVVHECTNQCAQVGFYKQAKFYNY